MDYWWGVSIQLLASLRMDGLVEEPGAGVAATIKYEYIRWSFHIVFRIRGNKYIRQGRVNYQANLQASIIGFQPWSLAPGTTTKPTKIAYSITNPNSLTIFNLSILIYWTLSPSSYYFFSVQPLSPFSSFFDATPPLFSLFVSQFCCQEATGMDTGLLWEYQSKQEDIFSTRTSLLVANVIMDSYLLNLRKCGLFIYIPSPFSVYPPTTVESLTSGTPFGAHLPTLLNSHISNPRKPKLVTRAPTSKIHSILQAIASPWARRRTISSILY